MADGLLERALASGERAAENALPKGNVTRLYRPTDFAFAQVKRAEKPLAAVQTSEGEHSAAMLDPAALSDALLLETLRYGRCLEARASG